MSFGNPDKGSHPWTLLSGELRLFIRSAFDREINSEFALNKGGDLAFEGITWVNCCP
jgi:hypothetical protein